MTETDIDIVKRTAALARLEITDEEAARLGELTHQSIIEIARGITLPFHAAVREDRRALCQGEYIAHHLGRRMRDIDDHASLVGALNDVAAEPAQTFAARAVQRPANLVVEKMRQADDPQSLIIK